jgi:hypothetical protein
MRVAILLWVVAPFVLCDEISSSFQIAIYRNHG